MAVIDLQPVRILGHLQQTHDLPTQQRTDKHIHAAHLHISVMGYSPQVRAIGVLQGPGVSPGTDARKRHSALRAYRIGAPRAAGSGCTPSGSVETPSDGAADSAP